MEFANIAFYVDPELDNQPMFDCLLPFTLTNKTKVTLLGVVKPLPQLAKITISTESLKAIEQAMILDTQKALQHFAISLKKIGIEVTTKLLFGETSVELIRQVLKSKFDLLGIMSAKNQAGISSRFFGSVQMQILRKCPCPVWLVKANLQGKIKHVLTPIDVSSEVEGDISLNNLLVRASRLVAEISQAHVHFLHVWSVFAEGYMSVRGGLPEHTIEKMRRDTFSHCNQTMLSYTQEEDWTQLKMDVEFICSRFASTEIIKTVQKNNIDLLIMGTVSRTGIAGFIIGNTAEKILTEVACSVLAFKPNSFVCPVTLDEE
jgi:universal stress protein E